MANKNPSKSSRFKKGQTGNPNGRPKIEPLVLKMKTLTAEEYAQRVLVIFGSTEGQLQYMLDDPKEVALNKAVAKTLQKAIETGAPSFLEALLARVLGKPKETIEHQMQSRNGVSILEEFRQMLNDKRNERQG